MLALFLLFSFPHGAGAQGTSATPITNITPGFSRTYDLTFNTLPGAVFTNSISFAVSETVDVRFTFSGLSYTPSGSGYYPTGTPTLDLRLTGTPASPGVSYPQHLFILTSGGSSPSLLTTSQTIRFSPGSYTLFFAGMNLR